MQGEQAKEGAGSGGPDRLTEIRGKVDALGRLFDQLEEARTAARRTRIGVIIVILLVFLGYGLVMYNGVKKFVRNELPKFQAEIQARMLKIGASAMDELSSMAGRVAPVYKDEVRTQLQARWPDMKDELTRQGELLMDNLADNCEARIRAKLTEMAMRQKSRVFKAFPVLKDDAARDRVMKNLDTAFQGATLDVLKDRIGKAEKRLREVNDKILKFLPEGDQERFQSRMSKAWDNFWLYDLGGAKEIP